jgi:TonB family protein
MTNLLPPLGYGLRRRFEAYWYWPGRSSGTLESFVPMRMLEHSPSESVATPREISPEIKQRRRMLAALAMLLIALIVVLYRNHQYFYTPSAASEQEPATTTASSIQPQASATASSLPGTPTVEAKSNSRSRTASHSKANIDPTPAAPPPVVDRAVLPALQVEVVAGDSHRTVQPGNSAIKVDMQPGEASTDQLPRDIERASVSGTVDASNRVRLTPDASQLVAHQVTPNYPLLAKQMKVQGAVVLQALIGKEGSIQDLQVLSGPTILSSAAREAVKQWRFKPYLQSGEPVETQAKITVNFTISTY